MPDLVSAIFLVILTVVVMLDVSNDDDDDDRNFSLPLFLAFVHSGWSVCDSFQVRR